MKKIWQKELHKMQKQLGRQHKHHHVASIYTVGILAIGAAAGATAGLLMAPEKGGKTRTKLMEQMLQTFYVSRKRLLLMTAASRAKMLRANEKAKSAAETSGRAAAPTRRSPSAA